MPYRPELAILRADPALSPIHLPRDAAEVLHDGPLDAAALVRIAAARPKVVLLDLRGLAGAPGAPIAAARAASPASKIVVVGTAGDEDMAQAALAAGATSFISREISPASVLAAVRDAMQGNLHLTRTGRRAVKRMLTPSP